MNQRLKIDLLTILNILNKMDDSDCNYGNHKVGFQSKRSNHKLPPKSTLHAQIIVVFYTADDQ